jgi:muramoyltetrapeptide carboxypeptidase
VEIPLLIKGSVIGIVAPSHIASAERYGRIVPELERLGFRVKLGENVYKTTYGYLASERERAGDFNAMVADETVNMVLFGGGEGGNELLPYIDFERVRENPKFYCSFSDGTTILNAIHARTGLPVFYGQGPGMFYDLRQFDYRHFCARFIEGKPREFLHTGRWLPLTEGSADGTLIGGYTRNFALLLGSRYFSYDEDGRYLLFLEDHEKFSGVAEVSSYLSHIEQSGFIRRVTGLLFGHYAPDVPQHLLNRLERFGRAHGIPVVYCDAFGHSDDRHGILPIGVRGGLDGGGLRFLG